MVGEPGTELSLPRQPAVRPSVPSWLRTLGSRALAGTYWTAGIETVLALSEHPLSPTNQQLMRTGYPAAMALAAGRHGLQHADPVNFGLGVGLSLIPLPSFATALGLGGATLLTAATLGPIVALQGAGWQHYAAGIREFMNRNELALFEQVIAGVPALDPAGTGHIHSRALRLVGAGKHAALVAQQAVDRYLAEHPDVRRDVAPDPASPYGRLLLARRDALNGLVSAASDYLLTRSGVPFANPDAALNQIRTSIERDLALANVVSAPDQQAIVARAFQEQQAIVSAATAADLGHDRRYEAEPLARRPVVTRPNIRDPAPL